MNHDDMIRTLLLDSARELRAQIADDIELIAANDFSDDDTDYMPARAETLAAIIRLLTDLDYDSISDALDAMIARGEFDALGTTDLDLPCDTIPALAALLDF